VGEKRFRALQTDKRVPRAANGCHATNGRCIRAPLATSSTAAAIPHETKAKRTHALTRSTGDSDDYLHIFFHPDSNRRLWLLTRSADPANSNYNAGARGLADSRFDHAKARRLHTAGGEFRPALKTY